MPILMTLVVRIAMQKPICTDLEGPSMSDKMFQLTNANHTKIIHLLEEIKRQGNSLAPENEENGTVITALAESIGWVMMTATQVEQDSQF